MGMDYVNCRIGSLEKEAFVNHNIQRVNCRIGSLENSGIS